MSARAAPPEVSFFDRELETVDRAALDGLQVGRLRVLLAEVAAHNVFYQRKWKNAGVGDVTAIRTLDGLHRLPLTTKQELVDDQQAHPPFGTILTYPVERYNRYHMTSGTTGRPLRWLDTPDSWDWWTRCWGFVYRAAGVVPEDRILFPFSFGPFIGFWAGFDAATRLGALTVPGGGQDSVLRLRTLIEASATVLVCTPSYALRLAQVAREQGIDPASTSIRVTIHAGEPDANIPGTKRRIEESWGAKCFDHCGMTDPTIKERLGERFVQEQLRRARLGMKFPTPNYKGMKTAPGLIVVIADFRFIRAFPVLNDGSETDRHYKINAERILLQSVAASTMLAHLAASALGYSVWWVSAIGQEEIQNEFKPCWVCLTPSP